MIPSVAIALPISVTFIKMNLTDTVQGLILANMISQIPFMAWILVSSFSGIPVTLDEAAAIDGAGKFQIIQKVILRSHAGNCGSCHVCVAECME
uniref:ABC transporter permease subunit n=1 Tax=Clostridium sp. NkU-1 TaxID=1095009 RepID=UPI0032619150